MAYPGACSFGSDDSGYGSAAMDVFDEPQRPTVKPQDFAKDVARQRQHILAGELSRLDAAEYQHDILDHMLHMDAETVPDVDSIDIQTEIQWFMRPYLLDFLTEAHSAFQLLPETLFLTINLLDRYCSKRVVYKRHYQLVGCAALLIAAKYGDKKEKVPTIKELKSMCCSLYDDDMFLQMEWHVLSTLGWTVGHPTVDTFLRLAVKDSVFDPEVESMTLYISEMAFYHRDFVSKRSSTLALSALALARHILGRPQPPHTAYASQFCNNTLVELSQKIHEPSLILSRKYSSARYSCAARLLTNFLAQQAAITAASQAPATPVYDTPTISVSKPSQDGYFAAYSTPQKQPHSSVVQHGYPTPPITPEDEQFVVPQKGQNILPQYGPPTPTPDTTTESFSSYAYQPHYHAANQPWIYEPF